MGPRLSQLGTKHCGLWNMVLLHIIYTNKEDDHHERTRLLNREYYSHGNSTEVFIYRAIYNIPPLYEERKRTILRTYIVMCIIYIYTLNIFSKVYLLLWLLRNRWLHFHSA